MYSLIWVGWVLLELFIKKHQILSFSGRDWSFFNLCMHKREQCPTNVLVNMEIQIPEFDI